MKLKNIAPDLGPWIKALILVLILPFSFVQNVFSQAITVDEAGNSQEVRDLVEDVLLGSCVTVSNISYTGPASASGTFDGGGTILGLDGGIILTTGEGNIAEGPDDDNNAGDNQNNSGDPDLTALAGITTYDAVILEFDFVPQSPDFQFNYIFGSEEYPEYVNSGYNDAFGFFISGPGISGPYTGNAENIALLPGGTTPVTIDNVNNGYSATEPASGPCTNCAYYVDNSSGPAVQYDGYTTVLTAEATVVPCQTYHIKLAIADAGDHAFDSGVFLEEASFSAGGGVTVDVETTTTPSGIYEGCNDAWFIFRRVDLSDNSTPITANFTISGTATPTVDYSAFSNSITIPAGEDSILINLDVVLDFVTEGSETIVVTMDDSPCTCLAPASATVNILDNDIPLSVTTTGTTTICLGQSTNLTASPLGSQTPYTTSWNNGAPAGDNVTVSPTTTTTYTYTVTDDCGGQTVTSSETVTVILPDFTINDDQQCFDGHNFSFFNTGATGGSVTHFWDFGDSNTTTTESPSHIYASSGNYEVTHYVIFTSSGCTATATANIAVFDEPFLSISVDQDVICSGGTDGAISAAAAGGTPTYNYLWSPGGQTTSSISGLTTGNYSVTISDANGCTDNASATIIQDDQVPPTAVCQDITVQLNAAGIVTISANDVDNGSTDNCEIASMVVSPNSFDCDDIGINTVTLTVTDVNGNQSTCSATVIVEDNVPPVMACQGITVYLDALGEISILPADVDAGTTDNCELDTLYVTPNQFTCSGVGVNPVTLTATDVNQNTSSCVANVTVIDTIAPIAVCQDITVQLDSLGQATVDPSEIDNGSNDACGVLSMTVDVSTFDCTTITSNTVILTVEDNNGDISTCTAEVTIEDTIAPAAVCEDVTLYLDDNGAVFLASADVNGGSIDNCSVDTVFLAQNDFTCADIGANIIELLVVDVNGNVDVCAAEITVLDTISPYWENCPNDTIIVPDSLDCSPAVFWNNPQHFDNCTATFVGTNGPGDTFPVGTTTVIYTTTDQSGNTAICAFDITIEPSPIIVNITALEAPCGYNLSCNGLADGEATAISGGGCLPYTYLWSDGQTNQTAIGLDAGSYAVTVTDANGNTATSSVTITEPDALATDSLTSPEHLGGANVSCFGEFDGFVNINTIGGAECVTYEFTWTGPNGFISTNEDISGLEAGTYVVTVTDASGCSYQDSITLVEPEELDAVSLVSDYNGVDISCGGAADGWIDLTVTGGAEPYTFTWNTGQITEDIDGLVAGIYTYTVMDANGCEIDGSITLVEPDELLSFFTTSDYNGYNISCFGSSDGSVDLTVNDGTGPYTYVWSNASTSEDLMNVPAGSYVFDITDANGCTLQDSVTLTQPNDIVITPIDTTILSCFGEEDGGFEVVASGGVPAFMYDWLDGQTGPIAQNLGAGSYMVTATDMNGCKDSILLNLAVPDLLVEVQVVDVVCFGQENGIVDVNLIGGTAPYMYNWSNDSISQDLNGVAAGTYTLEVTDANGCTDILSVVVSEPEQLIMTVDTVIDATCSGNSDGSITVQAQGGTPPYTYFWPNINQSGSSATGLAVGVYEVQVVDYNGCAWSLNIVVGQLSSIDAAIDVLTTVSCNELEDAEALVTATGGTEPYTYLWTNGDLDTLAEGLGAGTLMVTVSDAVGCDTTLSVEIVEPPALEITIDALYNVTCSGFSNGQVEVGIAGGIVPYDVSWSNGDLGYIANDLEAGSYTVYVTDANGCLDSLATVFTEPDTITMIQYSTNVVTCFGGSDGELTVLVDGGTPPFSYTWPLLGQTGNTATNLSTGWYTLVAMDDNGCMYTDSLLVTETEEIILTLTSDTVVCHGSGVEINASATGGAGNFSYSWDNGLGLGASHFVSPITATTYSVEITDQNGCSAEIASVTVDIATQPVAEFSSTSDEPCVLPTTFEFTNSSTNVTGYEWLLGNGSISTDENPTTAYDEAGSYTVTLIVTTEVGCSDTASTTVVVDDVPTADFTLDNAQGCAPIQVNFGLNSPSGLDYYWDFGDGLTSTAPNPTHWYELPGDFDVTLIVSTPGGCTDTLSSGAAVSVYPSPIAGFTPQQIAFPELGSEYEFINNSSNADLYNWDFGNGEQTDEFQPIYDYPGFGGYHVTLTAINEFGCADTAIHYINVESNTTLYVPNALGIGQPGNAGIFIPTGTGIEEYHLWIFDNWGNLLWETQALDNHSPAEGWDGQYKGQYVPQGSYVWKLDATFIGSEIWEGQESSNGKTSNTGSVMVLY